MADDTVIQEILLKGQDDIKAGFASIEQAGLQMFKSLEAASGASPLQKFALGVSGTIAAVTAITAGLFKWAESASVATAEMGRLASATGTTIEDFSTLAGALHLDPDKFATELKRMAVRVDSEWKQIQQSSKEAANLIIADTLAIQNAYLALERAAVQLGNADKTVSNQQVANSLAVKNAKIGLAEAIERQRIAEGGEVDPAFNERLNQEKAALAVKQARLALAEAQKKADEDATLAANKLAQSAADAESAQLKLSQAQEQAAEHSKNSIANLTKFVENLSKGVADSTLQVNASADNIIKGLIASVGPGISALQEFKGTFTSVATAPPALKDVILQLADVFKNMEDGATKTAISVAFFGRTIGEKMVAELSKGKDAIIAEQKALKDLGLELTKADQIIGTALEKSVDKLGNTLSILGKQFGLAFAPATTGAINSINAALEQSSGTIRKFGQTIDNFATPAMAGFMATFTGADLTKNFNLSPQQLVDAEAWQKTFTQIKNIAIGAFDVIRIAAESVALSLNDVFGKDMVSPLEAGIGLLILRFGGLTGAIVVAAIALEKLTGGLVTALIKQFALELEGVAKKISLIRQLISGEISFDKFLEEGRKISEQVEKSFQDLKAGKFKNDREIEDEVDKANARLVAKQAELAKALNKETANVESPAKRASDGVKGIGDAADASRAKVKDLANEIRLLDAAKGTNQPSAGGDIEVKSVTKDLLKGTGGDAAKSFGQIAIEAKKATDEIDLSLERLADLSKEAIAGVDELDQLLARLAEVKPPDADKFAKAIIDPFENVSSEVTDLMKEISDEIEKEIQGTELTVKPILDLSDFGKLAELETLVSSAISGVTEAVISPFRKASDGIISALQPALDFINRIKDSISGINLPSIPEGGGGSGFAEGGLFRGKPGRDTNLAWLTDLEYVMRPEAVSKYGVGFMHMLNSLAMPKFNAGGLVRGISQALNHNLSPIRIPAFAGGGLNVTPQGNQFAGHMTVDLRTNAGTLSVIAPPNTARELQRMSVGDRLASAGPAPNWVGRRGR